MTNSMDSLLTTHSENVISCLLLEKAELRICLKNLCKYHRAAEFVVIMHFFIN